MTTQTTNQDANGRTRLWYDCERKEAVSEAILAATSDHKDCAVTVLPPLSKAVDVDALNSLFGTDRPAAPSLSSGTIEFEYADVVVTVSTVGTIEVENLDRLESSAN
ncbi:HalOD1 output domain-containing protein [Haloferax sp. YSMS24]|uniref:HalOD1 output domain-containing protein n=1 Tax=Haloferax sp. YSMS24 TaxID=3388425 RepID=UPI00398D43B3